MGGCLVAVPHDAAAAIAFHEDVAVGLCEEQDLRVEDPIHSGSWCGRTTYVSFQDMIIATRRSTPDSHDFQFVPGEV